MASESARKFITHCDEQAEGIARILLDALYEEGRVKKSERQSLVAFCLSDELVHFFYNTLPLYLADPKTMEHLARMAAVKGGRASGAKRSKTSVKLRFLRWAIEENRRNPALSKNALAEGYARGNPGVSATTLRRYLADIPVEEAD